VPERERWAEDMKDWSNDIASFQANMCKLAARVAAHGIVIETRKYSPEAFHSWQIVAGTEKRKFDFLYDGQVSELRYHDAATVPKDFRDLQHASFRTWKGADPMAFVEGVLKKAFPV
jgi:hypothetical protein